jgi:hypothetical protein
VGFGTPQSRREGPSGPSFCCGGSSTAGSGWSVKAHGPQGQVVCVAAQQAADSAPVILRGTCGVGTGEQSGMKDLNSQPQRCLAPAGLGMTWTLRSTRRTSQSAFRAWPSSRSVPPTSTAIRALPYPPSPIGRRGGRPGIIPDTERRPEQDDSHPLTDLGFLGEIRGLAGGRTYQVTVRV